MKSAKIIIGLLLIIAGLYTFSYKFFRSQLIDLLKLILGNIGLLLILLGLIILILEIIDLE